MALVVRRVKMARRELAEKVEQVEKAVLRVNRAQVELRQRRVLRVFLEITEVAVLREVVVHLLPMVVVEPMAVVVLAELRVRRV
jgi:hypothetical protein